MSHDDGWRKVSGRGQPKRTNVPEQTTGNWYGSSNYNAQNYYNSSSQYSRNPFGGTAYNASPYSHPSQYYPNTNSSRSNFSNAQTDVMELDTHSQYSTGNRDDSPVLRLSNLGSTCFLSTTIQLLFCASKNCSTKLFEVRSRDEFSASLLELLNCDSSDVPANWRKFAKQFYEQFPETFTLGKQGDTSLCLEKIIEHLQPKSNWPFMCKEQVSNIACKRCPRQRKNTDSVPFLRFSGETNSFADISQEFDSHFAFDGQCEKCNSETKETHYFKLLPEILFVLTDVDANDLKNFQEISLKDASLDRNCYTLIGASVHQAYASDSFGHYISFVNMPERGWFRCNDSVATKETLLNYYGSGNVQMMVFKKSNK